MTVVWIVVGVVAILVVGGVLWWRFRDPLRGEDFYRFHAEQKWAWERQLDEEAEKAFMAGLEAYDDEHSSVFLHREEGVLRVSEPPMLISLYLLTARFRDMGEAAIADPVTAVRQLIDDADHKETGGVLHLRSRWLPDGEIDGMDKYEITSQMMSATHAQGVTNHAVGGYGDEDYGYGVCAVLPELPEHVREMEDEAFAHSNSSPIENRLDVIKAVVQEPEPEFVAGLEEADAEKSKYTNAFMYDYGRVLLEYQVLRHRMPGAQASDVFGAAMARMLLDQEPGITWTRPPSRAQFDLAVALLSTRG
ncbi:hypothetical protein SAXI111661_02870 [Saccharomonospora xinjiangensis]|uniref:hypothetical protein n=1 Tax=Saccharomonospora xinjiangensis TaxID=75294 RepID=UPI00106F8184|nr:hypothetical protein [Saccharomonospora xinjiangensis]QBQ59894.1 hypothetical protein EYD13_07650 [Saccharomonospora xinjiangensis]